MRTLSKDDLLYIAYGAGFLGSGGGGPMTTGLKLVNQLPSDTAVTMFEVGEVDPNGLTAIVADMGAPDAMLALDDPQSFLDAFTVYAAELSAYGKGTLNSVIPVEVGGLNTVVPLIVAAKLGVPIVNADGAGRAVPSLTQLTYSGYGVSTVPAILANGANESVSLRCLTSQLTEDMARPVLEGGFGEQAALAMWAMDPATLKAAAPVTGTLDLAEAVGKGMGQGAQSLQNALGTLQANGLKAEVIYQGTLIDIAEQTSGGFDVGKAHLQGSDGSEAWVYNQNENLIAWSSSQTAPLAMAPNSICFLDLNTGLPFSNADFTDEMKGHEVALVAIQARSALTQFSSIMDSFQTALRNLGYAGPLVPLGSEG